MVDFSKYKVKEESKKVPDIKNHPDSQEKKIVLDEPAGDVKTTLAGDITPFEDEQKVAHAQLSKKVPFSKSVSKKPDVGLYTKNRVVSPRPPSGEIDQKIMEFELRIEKKFNEFNERQLKLIRSGLEHELTIDNLIDYIKTHNKKTKLYKLVDFFKPAEPADIERMFKYLYQTKIIGRTQDNWYYLK